MNDASAPIQHRILARIESQPGGCWIWVAGRDGHGYGSLYHRGKQHGAHRLAYEAWHGEIPDGLEIDHLCSVPACVNPAHLEAVTHDENLRRAAIRRRHRTAWNPVSSTSFDAVARAMEDARAAVVAVENGLISGDEPWDSVGTTLLIHSRA